MAGTKPTGAMASAPQAPPTSARPRPVIATLLRRNAVGLRGQRPIGTFLLLGPTGVGKTETAKAIAEAYAVHGCKVFSLDSQEELGKIVAATADADGNAAEDLSLCVRLRVSSEGSELSLASKFGARSGWS